MRYTLGISVISAILSLVGAGGCSKPPAERKPPSQRTAKGQERALSSDLPGPLMRGTSVSHALARRPRFPPPRDPATSIRALPDGDLREWENHVKWIERGRARLAFASYGSGVSLAVKVADDRHRPATAAGKLERSDHVELELWPAFEHQRRPRSSTGEGDLLGIRLRLGTLRKLVQFLRPADQTWREDAVSSAGVGVGTGYVVEARLPLSVLTPLPVPKVETLHYRITVFDADGEERARPGSRFEGKLKLDPPLQVPEAVQKRASIRICMTTQDDAVWTYVNGWRCGVPYRAAMIQEDDADPASPLRLGYARIPEPPRIVWIRERLMFINIIGRERGVAALLDRRDTILSVMPLGVVGAFDPGNPIVKESDAEPMTLPDGTYAVAVTHALGARPGELGGRCRAGHRVYLSVLALRGCLKSTPHAPAPDPPFTPYLEEVFRTLLEDCQGSVANDWSLSRDRKTISVHSSLHPALPPTRWVYKDGRYRRREEP